jgi:hypothetical protein
MSIFVSLNRDSGEQNWLLDIPGTLHDYSIYADSLIVVTDTSISLVNPDNGSITTTQALGSGKVHHKHLFNRAKNYLYVTEQYTYVFVAHESRICVFSTADLSPVHVVALPPSWFPPSVRHEDKDTGKLMVSVRRATGNEFHRDGMIEFDPSKLDKPIEIEPGPETTIELASQQEDEKSSRLDIIITTESLDDAIRFGELNSQNNAYIYGFSVAHHCDPNPLFNGQVHLQIRTSDMNAEKLLPLLAIMEKRFSDWVEHNHIYSGDGKNEYCTLTTEYVAL